MNELEHEIEQDRRQTVDAPKFHPSVAIQRLIDEVRADIIEGPNGYNRGIVKHSRSGGYDRCISKHSRS